MFIWFLNLDIYIGTYYCCLNIWPIENILHLGIGYFPPAWQSAGQSADRILNISEAELELDIYHQILVFININFLSNLNI